MQTNCRADVLSKLGYKANEIPPEFLSLLDFYCSKGFPPLLIEFELRNQITWLTIFESIKQYNLSDSELLDLQRLLWAGESTNSVLAKAKLYAEPETGAAPKMK